MKLLTLLMLSAAFAMAQTVPPTNTNPNAKPSGLTTGPVTYTIPLTNPNASVTRIDDGSGILANAILCGGDYPGGPNYPVCPTIAGTVVGGIFYAGVLYNLVASDGTGNCYTFQTSSAAGVSGQFRTGNCQNSFLGCGMGEDGALYGNSNGPWTSIPANGVTLSEIDFPFTSWGGTAVLITAGACTGIRTNYDISVEIYHHSIKVWAPPANRTPWRLVPAQQIDAGSQVVITPQI